MERSIGIIGAEGLVGSRVVEHFKKEGTFKLVAPKKTEVDITDRERAREWVKNSGVDTIILLAAYTDVDGSQSEEGKVKADLVNVDGTRNIADAAKEFDKFLIYISTDFIFSGTEENPGPYDTGTLRLKSKPVEVGNYAWSKHLGELEVEKAGGKNAIVRISYPFGNSKIDRDFALKTIKLIKAGYALFSDQKFTPTYIPDLAVALSKISKEKMTGVYHVVCWPVTSPHEFGKYLAERLGLEGEVKEGSLAAYMIGRAPKPLKGGLVPSSELVKRDWKDAIDNFIEEIGV